MRLLLRWLITAIALGIAVRLVPGIRVEDTNGWIAVLIMAIAVGLVNAVIRPIIAFFTCPLVFLTLGLFTLVINAACLLAAAWLANTLFGAGFIIDNFGAAFWGSIIVSIVSALLSIFLHDDPRRETRA